MPADSFDGVAQKGEALNSLTQATDEVKEDAQVERNFVLHYKSKTWS